MMKQGKVLYGGDYNPEQWLERPDILEKDIEYMKAAGINTVTVGMFAWSVLEPEEGRNEFGWLERIVDNLYQNGISVIMGTPSGARPKWLADAYEEVLRVREDGVQFLFGKRHNHCYTSPVYREKVRAIDKSLAERFHKHPAVILWHISNEYEGQPACYCALCKAAFQEWLQRRYKTIEELNEKWCTTFWSHRYQSFQQVEPPSSIGEQELHGLTLDWKRFITEQTADFAENEIRALKEGGITQPITTNLMYDYQNLIGPVWLMRMTGVSWVRLLMGLQICLGLGAKRLTGFMMGNRMLWCRRTSGKRIPGKMVNQEVRDKRDMRVQTSTRFWMCGTPGRYLCTGRTFMAERRL